MKEQFLRPLECAPAGGVTVGHSVTLIHIGHHNLRLYGFSSLSLQKLPSAGALWKLVNMHTSLLSRHNIAVQSALVLSLMSPHFNFIVLCFRSSGMPFLFGLTVPQQ